MRSSLSYRFTRSKLANVGALEWFNKNYTVNQNHTYKQNDSIKTSENGNSKQMFSFNKHDNFIKIYLLLIYGWF